MLEELQSLWVYAPERVGLIMMDSSIVELENISEDSWDSFKLEPTSFEETYLNNSRSVKATWHTHPSTSANLSVEDYLFFLSLPHRWVHYIISQNEVRCYYARGNKVLLMD